MLDTNRTSELVTACKDAIRKSLTMPNMSKTDILGVLDALIVSLQEACVKAGVPKASFPIVSEVMAGDKRTQEVLNKIISGKVLPTPQVSVITRKSTGETKRSDPPTEEPEGFGAMKRKSHFFPGMANGNLLSYIYQVDGRRPQGRRADGRDMSAFEAFSMVILPMIRQEMAASGQESKWLDWWRKAAYPVPRQSITASVDQKTGKYSWERVIGGKRFTVVPTNESLNKRLSK